MMRILVTGGAGSMGRQLALSLASAGHAVRVLDLPTCDYAALQARGGIQILKGSIDDASLMAQAVEGVDVVVHLAALLPPVSERDRALTMAVNLEGTELLLSTLRAQRPEAHLVFSSSVCVYGDTSASPPPVKVERRPAPHDLYGESKAAAEESVRASGQPHTILRISGVAVPAFLEPPALWPFTPNQRIEYVLREDVVTAMQRAVELGPSHGTLNIAGGASWRMTGAEYVARFNQVMGLEPGDATYVASPGSYDWYDTEASQAGLGYQETSFEGYLEMLEEAIERALSAWE